MAKGRTKELIGNTLIIGLGSFSTQIISFLLLPIYTSILTPTEYGIYDLIITVTTFLLPIITLLMEESMFRFLIDCSNNEEKKKIISQAVLYITIATSIFLILASIVGTTFDISYIVLSVINIFTCIIVALRNALLRGLEKIKLYTISNFIISVVTILLNIVFIVVFRWGIYGLICGSIVSNIILTIILFVKLKIYKYVSFRTSDGELLKEMIKYSLPLVPNSLSWAVVNLSDRVVISTFMGTAANGIYSMAYKFPNLINTIYGFFYTAWKESSAKAIKDEDKVEFFNNIYKMLSNVMLSVSIGIVVCMPLFFDLFIKEAYSEAYLYVPILVISMYYNNMAGYYGGIFSGYKDTKIMGLTTILGAIINLVVNLLLIKFIGIYAAALSTLISCMFIYYYRKYKVKQYIELKDNFNILGVTILIITLFLYYINDNLIIKILNFVVVVMFSIYTNKDILLNLIKSIKRR